MTKKQRNIKALVGEVVGQLGGRSGYDHDYYHRETPRTKKVDRQAGQLAATCANFTGAGGCRAEVNGEATCQLFAPGFIGHRRCPQFERVLLPADERLVQEYWEIIAGSPDAHNVKVCVDCEADFEPRSNRQQRCDTCADIHRRQKLREYQAEARRHVNS
ncbi:hypothetical protein [Alkalicoccus chagannorensis]|uniref:hypothetical protein n=1 Tax=Alkalicoccus chagannorensis TaxID=427072 RepID=UPI00047E7B9D|nr:hypothetical protein [Alkalicoccus chagannorensis]